MHQREQHLQRIHRGSKPLPHSWHMHLPTAICAIRGLKQEAANQCSCDEQVKRRENTYEVVIQLLAKDVWDVDESLILGIVAGRCGDVGLYASDRFVCT